MELHDLNGSFSLVIAGESADFEFSLDSFFCEEYGIEIGKSPSHHHIRNKYKGRFIMNEELKLQKRQNAAFGLWAA